MKRNYSLGIKIVLVGMILMSLFVLGPVQVDAKAAEEISTPSVNEAGWQRKESRWYYYNESGQMQTSWTKVGHSWFYLDAAGVMQTGWQKISGNWYYLNASGRMQTGWTQTRKGGAWYYLNSSGRMQTGWQKINNNWYYMNSSGAMRTGWQRINGNWYYLNASGRMQTGWTQTRTGGVWYYLNTSGRMQTGWQKVNGTWYYLNASGAMQTRPLTLGGMIYTFYADGSLKSTRPADVRQTTPNHMKNLGASKQVILVTTTGMNTYQGRVRTFEKNKVGNWNQLINTRAYIGRNGFTNNKREGDMRTPTGKYTIGHAFGHGSKPNTRLAFKRATSNDVWVDDSNSNYYNTWQKNNNPQKDWKSAEPMNHELYKYGFVIDYNTAQIPGAGSAIFMHVARPGTGYTAGCIATSESDLLTILSWIDPAKNPVIIQDAESNLGSY